PLTVIGRYAGVGPCRWVLTGTSADGRPFRQHIDVELPQESDEAPGLARLWAKRRIDALLEALEDEPGRERKVKREVTELALAHSLASAYTSLVAVDSEVSTSGSPRRLEQPSPGPAPQGVTDLALEMSESVTRAGMVMSAMPTGAPPPAGPPMPA